MSQKKTVVGADLIQQVVTATGLPKEMVQDELNGIIERAGHDGKSVTLEQLRTAMLHYLESMIESCENVDSPRH